MYIHNSSCTNKALVFGIVKTGVNIGIRPTNFDTCLLTKTRLRFYICRSKRKTESEYYYDYGDYGAPGVDALPDAERVVGSQLCQPCRSKGAAKPGRPDPKLFRNGHVFIQTMG